MSAVPSLESFYDEMRRDYVVMLTVGKRGWSWRFGERELAAAHCHPRMDPPRRTKSLFDGILEIAVDTARYLSEAPC